MAMMAACTFIGASTSSAEYTADASHSRRARDRSCERDSRGLRRQGYHETAIVLDADGATIVALRGDGAGIHTLDSAHDKAYTSVSFKNDTLALAERAKGETRSRRSPSCRTSCSLAAAW